MCAFEKSKNPVRMPTFDWIVMDSRSADENVMAFPKRLSHQCGSAPYTSA